MSFNDGNGGKGGGTTGDNSGNADNNERNDGLLTASFCPPKLIGHEPAAGIYNLNEFLCLFLDRHPE